MIGIENSHRHMEEDEEKVDKTRRKIVAGGLFAGVAGVTKWLSSGKEKQPFIGPEYDPVLDAQVEKPIVVENKELIPPGQTIQTPIGRMGMVGFKLSFDEKDLRHFSERAKNNVSYSGLSHVGYHMLVHAPKNLHGKRKEVGGFEVFVPQTDDRTHYSDYDDEIENPDRKPRSYEPKVIGTPIRFKDQKRGDLYGQYTFPYPEQPELEVEIRLNSKNDGKNNKTQVYKYRLAVGMILPVDYKREVDAVENPEEKKKIPIRIFSEVPLPPGVLSKLHQIHKACSEYQRPSRICIVEGDPHAPSKEKEAYHIPSHGEGDHYNLIRMNAEVLNTLRLPTKESRLLSMI